MLRISVTCFCIFLFLLSFGQCDSPVIRYTATGINDLAILNNNVIITVGGYGRITKSTDGGKSWRNIPVNNGYHLNSVQFTTAKKGYCAGDWGVWKTEDEGEGWFPILTVKNSYEEAITDIYFTGADSGFFVGRNGLIYSTADGGRTIHTNSQFYYPSYYDGFNSIHFLNDSTGIIGGSSYILKTGDAGKTWDKVNLADLAFNIRIRNVKFVTSSIAYGVSRDGQVIKSTDGGATWNIIYKGGGSLNDLYFFDENNGIIVGSGGDVLKTSDGGKNFEYDSSVPSRGLTFNAIKAYPGENKKLMIVGTGSNYYNGAAILSSSDKGAHWQTLTNNTGYKSSIVKALNDSVLIAGGEYGYLVKSTDYGESWSALQFVPAPYNNGIQDFWFIDSLYGYASTGNISLYRTRDGAKTWEPLDLPLDNNGSNFYPRNIYFKDSLHGMIMNTLIYTTDNGGKSWKFEEASYTSDFLVDLCFKKDGQGFAVGYNGNVLVSDKNGLNWKKYNLNTTDYLTGVYFYNNNIGFIGTGDTAIYKTIDGGVSWKRIYTGISYLYMTSFAFKDSLNGFMVGNNQGGGTSNIYITKDGGNTWQFLTQESANLSKITGQKNFYFVGYDGIVAKFDKQFSPSFPGYINGNAKVCINEASTYKVPGLPGEEYTWSLQGEGTHFPGNQYDTVVWTKAGKYNLSVTLKNGCAAAPSRTLEVEAIDFKPSITITDTTLNVTKGAYYRWYVNDTLIKAGQGDSASMLFTEKAGFYRVEVASGFGCARFTDRVYYKPAPVHNIKPGTWSNAANWSNRRVPGALTDIILNFDIILDKDGTCKSIKTQDHKMHLNTNVHLVITGKSR